MVRLGGDAVISRSWRILVLSLLLTGGGEILLSPSQAQTLPKDPEQRRPEPIAPPHRPAQQGVRLTVTTGLNFVVNGKYKYDTAVTMPDGSALRYSGNQRASGGALSLGAAATPGGALRRFTVGFDLNFGGLSVAGHPVVPAGSVTPFSQNNLNTQVAARSLVNSHWRPFISPYVEHEIGSIFQNRVRLGYQYFNTAALVNGSFAIDQPRSTQASYSVRFSQASNMVRLSVHNDSWFDDTDPDQAPPKRRTGIVQEGGILVGTDATIVVFVKVGPVWTF